jgi:hypothetical protein
LITTFLFDVVGPELSNGHIDFTALICITHFILVVTLSCWMVESNQFLGGVWRVWRLELVDALAVLT